MKITSLLVLLSLTMFAQAQSNYKPGYVITNTNDTITGLIDFRQDRINSKECRFKTTEDAPVQIYHPGDISRYRFINEGKYYISRTVTIDSIPRLTFLEFLVSGTMNLYLYLDPDSEQSYYFFEDEQGKMISVTKKQDEAIGMKLKNLLL